MSNVNNDLATINSLKGKWWYDHQSPKECYYGSDGVGHDFIHPADKLEAACRNAKGALHEVKGCEWKLEEMHADLTFLNLDKGELTQEIKRASNVGADPVTIARLLAKSRKLQTSIDRMHFEIGDMEDRISEMKGVAATYVTHAKELHEVVQQKYVSHDDAMEDIWVSRMLYTAMVKANPLGMDLKIAILPENIKEKVMIFLKEVTGFDERFVTPNADLILSRLDDIKKSIGEDAWKKFTQLPLGLETSGSTQG